MSKPLRILLFVLLWIILLGGGFVAFWVRDANLTQPAIEERLQAPAGAP